MSVLLTELNSAFCHNHLQRSRSLSSRVLYVPGPLQPVVTSSAPASFAVDSSLGLSCLSHAIDMDIEDEEEIDVATHIEGVLKNKRSDHSNNTGQSAVNGVSCIANYTYDASDSNELTIRPGDVLQDVDQLPGGWWRGELNGRRGVFPDNFVSVITDRNNSSGQTAVQGHCRAVYSYQPANSDELPLCVGDVLEVLREIEEGWWEGRRQGRVGVFPSNFVVMLEPSPAQAAPPLEPAPALPPKPVKEQCRVLFSYTAVNEDELSLAEGDIVTLVSRDTADRGWWRGELNGRVGLFPDNFVQLLPASDPTNFKNSQAAEDESKPERPPAKTSTSIYPALNKYFEKTSSVKELVTSKTSMTKESTVSKESSAQTTVASTNKSETEKHAQSKTNTDGALDALKFANEDIYDIKSSAAKKPSVPAKKSTTPTTGVGGLFSGLKSKMMPSTDKDKSEKQSPNLSSGSSNGGEWDRPDGGAASKPSPPAAPSGNTFDHVERNSLLNDPRAGRAKAPRRRPPSQALRDDTPQQIGLSNGHEVPVDKPTTEKVDAAEIKPRAREWEKHKVPWMEELKLNQAKKTSVGADGKPRAATGSTDRILDCGLEEKRSTHSMEMSKSTSSISNRISLIENLESSSETKVRHSVESKKEPSPVAALHSPTAAGRTLTAMLDEIKKPQAPPPPSTARTDIPSVSPSRAERSEKVEKTETNSSIKMTSSVEASHKSNTLEKTEKIEKKLVEKVPERPSSSLGEGASTLERRSQSQMDKMESSEVTDAMIAQLNNRIINLEKLLEVQNVKFTAAIEHVNLKLSLEIGKRQALQAELEKLAQCVTQV